MREARQRLEWQSKAILLIVVPWTAMSVVLQSLSWARNAPVVAWTTLGISGVFGLIVWRMRAGTLAAAATGAAITASLMYSTTRYPYEWSWLHGGLLPLLAVFLLTYAATKIGQTKKEKLGTGEGKRGRNAAQVAANLGVAALAVQSVVWGLFRIHLLPGVFELVAISALAEAAADTVSSEIGQILGGTPHLITTFRAVAPGTDGGVTAAGTVAGILSAAIVSGIGIGITGGAFLENAVFAAGCTLSATFGLLFDSLLGATLERKGLLNNDAVNFLSTLASVLFALPLGILLAGLYLHV